MNFVSIFNASRVGIEEFLDTYRRVRGYVSKKSRIGIGNVADRYRARAG